MDTEIKKKECYLLCDLIRTIWSAAKANVCSELRVKNRAISDYVSSDQLCLNDLKTSSPSLRRTLSLFAYRRWDWCGGWMWFHSCLFQAHCALGVFSLWLASRVATAATLQRVRPCMSLCGESGNTGVTFSSMVTNMQPRRRNRNVAFHRTIELPFLCKM